MNKPYHVYILECSDGKYYTGISTDPELRVVVHNKGKGAKFTASRRPVKLIYTEEHPDKSSALKREKQIKALSRAEKEILVNG